MLKAVVMNEACAVPSSWTVAKTVPPSLNATEPVGIPGAEFADVTVAVNTTACPKLEGFEEELIVVDVPF
jgi:hypothetical protein